MARTLGGAQVSVEGLAELRRALGQIDRGLQKNLRGRLKVVGDKVAADARSQVPVKTGKARASVKSGVSGNNAYVQEGSRAAPYARWLDFGGVLKPTGRRRNTIVRPVVRGGRYLYPAIRRNQSMIAVEAARAFEDTARELGL